MMTSGTAIRTPRRLDRHARREAIVAAAASAFAAGGYSATSMADLAHAAGVSHLIVYRHFDSKDDLYTAVLERARAHLDEMCAVPAAIGTYGPTPAALLKAARADPDAFAVLWRHAGREPEFRHHTDAARQQLEQVTADSLAPMVATRHRRWAARATIAYLVEAVLVWIEDGDATLDRRFATATQAALRAGVRSWSRPEPTRGVKRGT